MKTFLLLILVLLANISFSQQLASPEVICTAGNYDKIENSIQVSWTLGEIVTETYSNSSYSFTQGFQQESYSIEIAAESVDYLDFFTEFSYYPNPFQTFFNLNLSYEGDRKLKLILFAEEGKKILIQKIVKGENQVHLQNFNSQLLFATIIDENLVGIISFNLLKQ